MKAESGTKSVDIVKWTDGKWEAFPDALAIEEPLEMRIEYGPLGDRQLFSLAVTMRTPGTDEDLIRGFLLTEGIVDKPSDITDIRRSARGNTEDHSVTAEIDPAHPFDASQQQRHFYTTSSCGVCGKASIDMVRQVSTFRTLPDKPVVYTSTLRQLGQTLREAQPVFEQTGGIHAAAFFDSNGRLLAMREDIGRHNAVDKLIGAMCKTENLPFDDKIMLVSGRAGFELVQKATVAGVAFFAAVGAPSSLAVELARDSNMTLVGFLRSGGFNIYSGQERVKV